MIQFILSWRYFTKKRVAWAAIAAVSLIVMMVVIVLNVMSGLVNEVRGKNHIWSGDIVLNRSSLVGFDHYADFSQILTNQEYIQAVTPVITAFGIAFDDLPVPVYGIELSTFKKVVSPGKLQTDDPDFPDNFTCPVNYDGISNGCFAGRHFGSGSWQGRQIGITFPGIDYRGMPAGPEAGMNQNFKVVDMFKTGMPDIDIAIYVDFNELQKLCWMAGQDNNPPRIHELRIKLREGTKLEEAVNNVDNLWETFVKEKDLAGQAKLLRDVKVQRWDVFRRANIEPLEHEKNMMSLVFCLIAVVCSFIIFAIFHMIVLEKQKDIGIIKSCGGSRGLLAGIYLYFGLIVGLIGTVIGVVLGVTFVFNTNKIEELLNFKLWPEGMYAIEKIPDTVVISDTVGICLAAIIFSVAGALIPAILAARQNPVESLRIE